MERQGNVRSIKINFEPWFPKEKLPKIIFYLSSEHNSYTITFGEMMNGKILTYVTLLRKWAMMGIKAGKFNYFKWEICDPVCAIYPCFEKCPRKCTAMILQIIGIERKKYTSMYI